MRLADARSPVGRQAALAIASRGAGVAVLVALTPYLASQLGPDGYGLWVLVTAATGLAGILDLGVSPAMSRVVAHAAARGERSRIPALVGDALVLSVVPGLVLVTVAWPVVPAVVDGLGLASDLRDDAETALRLAFCVFVVATAAGVLEGTVVGLGRLGRVVTLRLASVAAFGIAAVVVLASNGNVAGLAAVQLAVMTATLAGALAVARLTLGSRPVARPRLDRRAVRELLSFGLPRQTSRVWLIGALHYERYVVGLALGTAAAGNYGIASVLAGGTAMLLVQAGMPLIPALTAIAAERGHEEARRAHRRALTAFAPLSAGAFGALGATAAPLLAAFAGPDLAEPGYLQLLAAGFLLWTVAHLGFTVAQAIGTPAVEARAALTGLVATLACAPIAIAAAGEAGVAIGTTAGLAVGALVLFARVGSAPALAPCAAALACALPFAVANGALLDPAASSRATMALLAAAEALLFAAAYAGVLAALRRTGTGSPASPAGSANGPDRRTGRRRRPG